MSQKKQNQSNFLIILCVVLIAIITTFFLDFQNKPRVMGVTTGVGTSGIGSTGPKPTGIATSGTYIQGADGTWCRDPDSGSYTIFSTCTDSKGSYSDFCTNGVNIEFYCSGTWNGKYYTAVSCNKGGATGNCSGPSPRPMPSSTPAPTSTPIPTQIPLPTAPPIGPNCTMMLYSIQTAFATTCGQAKYSPTADVNKDHVVNILDFSLLSLAVNKPNSENSCAQMISNNADTCSMATSCSTLYGKIYNSFGTGCSQPENGYRQYSSVADLNKDKFVTLTDLSKFNSLDKTNSSVCQSYLNQTANLCVGGT